MKLYVDELPKSCAECEWFTSNHIGDHRNFCLLARMPFYNTKEEREKGRGQHKNGLSDFECPLKPLAEYDKKIKNKVIQKLKFHCDKSLFIRWYDVIDEEALCNTLDQIQGEMEGENL